MKTTNCQFIRMKGNTVRHRTYTPMLQETREEYFSSPYSFYWSRDMFTAFPEGIKKEKYNKNN